MIPPRNNRTTQPDHSAAMVDANEDGEERQRAEADEAHDVAPCRDTDESQELHSASDPPAESSSRHQGRFSYDPAVRSDFATSFTSTSASVHPALCHLPPPFDNTNNPFCAPARPRAERLKRLNSILREALEVASASTTTFPGVGDDDDVWLQQ